MNIESHLEEFVCVVEKGSVSAAARTLGVPRASVRRRLVRLEEHYSTALIHRETHRQTLTEAGRELYQRARRITAELRETQRAVSVLDGVPRGLLRVGLPPGSGVEVAIARVFRERFPEVQLELIASFTHDDMLAHGLDVALRPGVVDESLVGRKLVTFKRLVYAAPQLLEREGVPTVDTLPRYPCVLGFDTIGRPIEDWPTWDGGRVLVSGAIRSNSHSARIDAARSGLGLVLTSERIVREAVRDGTLVGVLHDKVGEQTPFRIVWPATDFMQPKVRAFIDTTTEVLSEMVRLRDLNSE